MGELSRKQFLTGAAMLGVAGAVSAVAPGVARAEETTWDDEADVVIVGAGGGGLAAAVTAAQAAEQDVLVLEVMGSSMQSDSALCNGMIQAACTRLQEEAGIEDSVDEFDKLLEAVAEGFEVPELRRLFAENGGATVDWLCDLGVEFGEPSVFGTAAPYYTDITPQVARTVTCPSGGAGITDVLEREADAAGARFSYNTQATRLVTNADGDVVGVKALREGNEIAVKARKGVVLATGGFTRNKAMVKKFMTPMLTHMKTDVMTGQNEPVLASGGSPWQMGDGVRMGMAAGADLSCTMFPYAYGVGIRTNREDNSGALVLTPNLYVNQEGRRFVRENMEPRENVVTEIWKQSNGVAFTIFDQAIVDRNDAIPFATLYHQDFYDAVDNGYLLQFDTIEELAQTMGIDVDALVQTVEEWNTCCEAQSDPFGRFEGNATLSTTAPMPVAVPPYYAAQIGAVCQDTASGLAINTDFAVLNPMGEVIPRLYAVGNTTGGVKGRINVGCGQGVGWTITGGRLVGPIVSALEPQA